MVLGGACGTDGADASAMIQTVLAERASAPGTARVDRCPAGGLHGRGVQRDASIGHAMKLLPIADPCMG